jgi:hypothetical protein
MSFVAGVLVLLSLPASAGAAAAAYAAADAAYGVIVPRPGPTAILLRGLFAVWSALLFCWLVELAAGAAGRLAGRDALRPGCHLAGEVGLIHRVRA